MGEKEVEKMLSDSVKRLGGKAYKWVSPGNNGVPDRIVIFPNQPPIFVELKTETGKLSAIQRIQCERLVALGQEVDVLYGIRDVAGFFQRRGYLDTARTIQGCIHRQEKRGR